jgi:Protein of unknown function (DUF3618)
VSDDSSRAVAGDPQHDDREDLSAQELAARIAEERHALGNTVQALAAKADVPARAKDKAGELRRKATSDPSYALVAAGGLCVLAGLWLWRRAGR